MPVLLNQRIVHILQLLRRPVSVEELAHRLNAGTPEALAALARDITILEQHDVVLRTTDGQLRLG